MLYYIIPYYIILYDILLSYILLYYILLYYILLYYIILYYTQCSTDLFRKRADAQLKHGGATVLKDGHAATGVLGLGLSLGLRGLGFRATGVSGLRVYRV